MSHGLRSMNVWIGVGTLGSIGLAIMGTSLGAIPRPGDTGWWFNVPAQVGTLPRVGFYSAVLVLIAGWVGVGVHARAGRLTVSRAWVILALWGLPLLVGPPIFSRDIYSYIAQGLLANQGHNPYIAAPAALGNPHLLASVAEVWRHTASPYGPLFVVVSRVVATVAGSSLVAQVLAFRLIELAGVVMIMVSLPRLARRLGNDPGLALWLGALSPLALFSFIASGHNDALMVGLLLAGITLAMEGRLAAGVALCALAATIKLPAAAAIVFIGVDQFRMAQGKTSDGVSPPRPSSSPWWWSSASRSPRASGGRGSAPPHCTYPPSCGSCPHPRCPSAPSSTRSCTESGSRSG